MTDALSRGVPSYPAAFVPDGATVATPWRVADPKRAVSFDRSTEVGLHRLALTVADRAALAATDERIRAHPGVAVEGAPGPMRAGSGVHHFLCAMPGGVRLEFATAPA